MVLSRILAVFALLAAACVTARPVVRAPKTTPIATALVQDSDASRDVTGVPDALTDRVKSALDERNLAADVKAPEVWAKDFSARRTTQFRLQTLAAASQAELVLLVETKASFYSLLNGRFRWTVHAKATISKRDSLADAVSTETDFPVFLDFDFQREPEALTAAAGTIADDVGRLADQFLAGTQTAGPAHAAAEKRSKIGPGDSIYFIMVDRFHNGDPSNDGEIDKSDPQAFHGGDLQGVLDKLDYIQDLGFTTVWLSPVFKMRTAKFEGHGAFHGYWVEDFGRVEPRFGDEALLKRLSDELHRRGMKLVLDIVLNHVAYDAPLVKAHPEWFHHNGDIKDWNDRGQLENNDVHGLPDLAQENEEVYQYLLANSVKWIDAVHPDGFRLDAVKHVPLGFWARYNEDVRKHAGADFFLLGEDLDGNPERLAKTLKEGKFTSVFDFPLYFAAIDVFCKGAPIGKLGATLFQDSEYGSGTTLVTLLDNHDLPRLMSACGRDSTKAEQALLFLLSVRGIPSVMYGTESGLEGAAEPANRADMNFHSRFTEAFDRGLTMRTAHPKAFSSPYRLTVAGDDVLGYETIAADEIVAFMHRSRSGEISFPYAYDVSGKCRTSPIARDLLGRPAAATCSVVTSSEGPLATLISAAPASSLGPWLRIDETSDGVRQAIVVADGAPLAEGDKLVICGSSRELGFWDPSRGIVMGTTPPPPATVSPHITVFGSDAFFDVRSEAVGHERYVAATLSGSGIYEFKLAIIRRDGTVEWEQRPNRYSRFSDGLALTWNESGPEKYLGPPHMY